MFRKAKATSLSPHHLYDCSIDLMPGTLPPKGHLHTLSGPEQVAMESYIIDSSAASIIISCWGRILLCGEEGQDLVLLH